MWTTDVHIRGCRVHNGDDCITIKSGSSVLLFGLDFNQFSRISQWVPWRDPCAVCRALLCGNVQNKC